MIKPTWRAPSNIAALSTTRDGGVSKPPFASLNLGAHVGDLSEHVQSNRKRLSEELPADPIWVNQVHSAKVLVINKHFANNTLFDADALFTRQKNQPLAIMTADCLPILLTSRDGAEVAAIHGGWRGLAQGIITNTLSYFDAPSEDIIAWLGPAIGATQFEVGEDVKIAFCQHNTHFERAFIKSTTGKYMADIYAIAAQQLSELGVKEISGGDYCTVNQPELFFSYRREGQTGRMASVIWRK